MIRPGRRAVALDWLARGPFAIAASALQGGMNYFIVLFLTFQSSLVATGEYRTLFSCYSLLQLATMIESNKIFIRSVVAEDRAATTAIVFNRIVFGAATLLLTALLWAAGVVPGVVVAIAAIIAVSSPFDLYLGLLMARRRFLRMFVLEVIKYGLALAVFLFLIAIGRSVLEAVIAQLLVIGVCQLAYFARYGAAWFDLALVRQRGWRLIRDPAPAQSRVYSIGNALPTSLESIDKLLVGYVFGLHFLGVYTLAYSTGRFVYTTLKPAMYVYYRRFVDAMPPWPLMIRVSLAFTALGAASAIVFLVLVARVPALAKFEAGKWATVILFLSYGLGMLNSIYSQAFTLNKDSLARDSLLGNVLSAAATLAMLVAALQLPPATALIVLALQYPVRDGSATLAMALLRRRSARRGMMDSAQI